MQWKEDIRRFESFANSKRYKTLHPPAKTYPRLRALLIQKDTKQKLTPKEARGV